jgi:tetratricopeptide (TPR) repeat protein
MKHSLEAGIQFYSQKRYEQARAELLALDEKPEENPAVAYYLGLTYTQLEEYEKAIPLLEYVILTHRNLFFVFQCRMVLGYIYSVTRRFQLAEIEFRNLLKLGVESPQVFTSLGYALYAQGKTEEGVEELKKALKYKPDYASALNNLGFIYAEEGAAKEKEQAVALCKQAVKRQPGNPVYLDSLGWALFKAGNLVDAKAYLRKAFEASKGNKEIAAHLKAVMSEEKKQG